MPFSRKLISILLIAAMLIGMLFVGDSNNLTEEEKKKAQFYETETVYLWYSDDSLTDFFANAAVAYHEKNDKVRVVPVLVSGLEYLEAINEASLENENYPDIYVLTNDSLERAYLSGLASKADIKTGVLDEIHFPRTALDAVTYRDEIIGYPLFFETSALLYNKTYLQNWVDKVNSGQAPNSESSLGGDELESLEGEEGGVPTDSAEQPVDASEPTTITVEDMIPKTMDDLLAFADEYDAPEGVQGILKWDVSDIFYNYFFVGNYMNVGGPAGDDSADIDIYNENTIRCMWVYQNLNQFFSIDAKTSNYNSIIDDFINGRIVYTIATTNVLAQLREAKENGTLAFDYGLATIPMLTSELNAKSLSVTDTLVINGYSEKKAAANDFAAFVTTQCADSIYTRTGKVAASYDAGYTNELSVFQQEYANSIPLPKIVETSNLWVQLEITFTKIWMGEDADTLLRNLSEQIMTQITGEKYTEQPLQITR